MGKKMEKVKDFGKKHWKKILGAAVIVGVAGGVGYHAIKGDKSSVIKLAENVVNNNSEKYEKMRLDRIKGIDWNVGKLEDITRTGDFVETWVDKVPVTEMGKLGEEMISNVEGITADSKAWALISINNGTTNG